MTVSISISKLISDLKVLHHIKSDEGLFESLLILELLQHSLEWFLYLFVSKEHTCAFEAL